MVQMTWGVRQQIRECVAAAGLLEPTIVKGGLSRPGRRQFEQARAAAGKGTALSDLVTKDRG
jgi:hypothetical protein